MVEVQNFNVDLADSGEMLPVVRDLSFRIPSGHLLGLIGESGSGKSVTGLSIAGVHRSPDWQVSGSVSMDGVPVPLGNEDDMRRLRGEDICFVMQNPMSAFDPLFTIREHFQETREAHGKKGADVDQIAIPLLERIHIRDPKQVLKSYPFECSGGMLQRIMIAIAVMNQPKLLIADEPTTALDRTVQYEIIRLLGELKGSGSAILFISHDLKAVSYIADEIAVMYGGYIVETGSVHEIMEHPQHPYTRALISATPSYCKEVLPVLKGIPPTLRNRPKVGCPFAPRCPMCEHACEEYDMSAVTIGGRKCRCRRSL